MVVQKFFGSGDWVRRRMPKVKVGLTLARKLLGFRYTMSVTPLDPSLVKGSHGVVDRPGERPVFATSEPTLLDDATLRPDAVRDRILEHVFR